MPELRNTGSRTLTAPNGQQLEARVAELEGALCAIEIFVWKLTGPVAEKIKDEVVRVLGVPEP